MRAVHRVGGAELSVGWLIVVARRRLVDHWRREERRGRRLRLLEIEGEPILDPWTEPFDVDLAVMALTSLGPHHRAALTLRYLDGLPVADVRELGRGFHATEALLQRARSALRRRLRRRGASPCLIRSTFSIRDVPVSPSAAFSRSLLERCPRRTPGQPTATEGATIGPVHDVESL